MRGPTASLLLVLGLALAAFVATAGEVRAQSQEQYSFAVSLLGGVGGSVDENDAGFGNGSIQLGFANVVEGRTHVVLRLGQVGFSSSEPVGTLFGADLTYLTLGGEYRASRGFFSGNLVDSGVYISLGGYQLEGTEAGGGSEKETSIGLAVGLTGDFEISRNFALRLELSGHYAGFDNAQFFGMAHAGLAYRF